MKKSVYITAAGILITATALFGFQNCSGPEDANLGSTGSSSSNGVNGVAGGANSTTDLGNTGVSAAPTTPAAPVAPPGSVASSVYVTVLYSGLLQRTPTASELSTWAQYIGLGYGCSFIAQQVLGSAEYVTLVPNLAIATITLDLTKGLLNRSPSPTEQAQAAALATQYPTHAAAAAAAAAYIISQPEFQTYCSQYKNMTP